MVSKNGQQGWSAVSGHEEMEEVYQSVRPTLSLMQLTKCC